MKSFTYRPDAQTLEALEYIKEHQFFKTYSKAITFAVTMLPDYLEEIDSLRVENRLIADKYHTLLVSLESIKHLQQLIDQQVADDSEGV